jgi:hypothetical protein
MAGGWGFGAWGFSGWGIPGLGDELALVEAEPLRENVVRLRFNMPVRYTGLLDPYDASNPERFEVRAVDGATDAEGDPARAVLPARVVRPREAGLEGRELDLWVDRAFSSYPARYAVIAHQLRATTGELLAPGLGRAEFDGLAAVRAAPMRQAVSARGDFANPQTREALTASGVVPVGAAALLGSYPIDASGDYASDQGLTSYKKRIVRRLTTRRQGFAHLADYGVGAVEQVKQLDRPGVRQELAAQAVAQISREPETVSVTVEIVTLPEHPEIAYFKIRATTSAGALVDMDVPFTIGGA